ncbi:MAG: VOC family protein [Deltaproteobacteria bacterium]|nr:MAG: VOC family protein [Deltaproteobacteria bacterium]
MAKYKRPPGHHTITPGFSVANASKVVEFLQQAFGAEVVERYDTPNGAIAHAELRFGDSIVMCGEAMAEWGGAMPAALSLYVDDAPAVDETYRRALAAGATSVMEPRDQFYGHRSATVKDSGGNKWTISAIVEEVSPQEVQRRMAAMMKG